MVLLNLPKNSQVAAASNCELILESGRCIRYVAPAHANPTKEIYTESVTSLESDKAHSVTRKRSSYDASDPSDDWEGVNALCQTLDTVLKCESEDIVKGKNVLEIGFCTGLPSVFALENGASHVTLCCADDAMLNSCVKPTLARNKVKQAKRKFIYGDVENLKRSSKEKHYDVIFATELLNTDRVSFEHLHDILDYALAPDGICLLTARMYYFNCEGNLPVFLDLIKSRGKFEVYTRWTSSKNDVVQRKVIQLTRTIR
ncbi:Uncharacterized protein F22B7.9 [Toxocara canis]|uniref:Uncharacterized protein F22B7.9 n=2 Tax=Toxocara canis TaxID=6265 RepID=A0A0B2VM61_TOXCA|nr:Uncharacterized protein F22B7.9 [Toxocara canis]VDM41258.1 unnamed protein product [Toxocara canis]